MRDSAVFRILLFAAAAALFANGPLHATTVAFTGTVNAVPVDDHFGDIAFGDSFFGTYRFDPAAPDLIAGPTSGSYTSNGPGFGMSVTIGSHVFSTDGYLNIGVFNGAVDQYTVLALSSAGGEDLTLEIFLQDNTGTAFSSDTLPSALPTLSAFAVRDFHLVFTSDAGETQVDGTIGPASSSAVPEPATGVLLFAGAGILYLTRKNLIKGVIPMSRFFVFAVLLGAATHGLWAVDGVVLIDQAHALAGNITPGDAPGFPIDITQPGSYRLSGNLTVPPLTPGIRILASNVTLDLNGFTITDSDGGRGCSTSNCDSIGITTDGVTKISDLKIRNGFIVGFVGPIVLDPNLVDRTNIADLGVNGSHVVIRHLTFGTNAVVRQVITGRGIILQCPSIAIENIADSIFRGGVASECVVANNHATVL